MDLTIETVIVLRKAGHDPVYFTLAEAKQMGGGFAQMSALLEDGLRNAAHQNQDQDSGEDEGELTRKQREPNGYANDKTDYPGRGD